MKRKKRKLDSRTGDNEARSSVKGLRASGADGISMSKKDDRSRRFVGTVDELIIRPPKKNKPI